jgi:hypothetical protein
MREQTSQRQRRGGQSQAQLLSDQTVALVQQRCALVVQEPAQRGELVGGMVRVDTVH